ncbi:MAG: hypothetical protein JO090_07845 [Rhizobacter sp.]|nr:hypothetical protein [Rhizobacter sp.]
MARRLRLSRQTMFSLTLVFVHLLAASMALGAIVATDLRLLGKLAQDRVRIAPPNAFVVRIVVVSLVVLCLTGAAIVWHDALARPGVLANPKLQAKVVLVALLATNAFVLHQVTFPRLTRGRRIARWGVLDWVAIAVPIAASNALWLFVAFLGVARAWNDTVALPDVLAAAAVAYLAVQTSVVAILVIASRPIDPEQRRWSDVVRRTLASIGDLGASPRPLAGTPRRRFDDPVDDEDSQLAAAIAIVAARTRVPSPTEPDLQFATTDRVARPRRR